MKADPIESFTADEYDAYDFGKCCPCGSGKFKEREYDARGIFLTHVCDDCRRHKLSRFRSDVLSDPGYWADEPIEG